MDKHNITVIYKREQFIIVCGSMTLLLIGCRKQVERTNTEIVFGINVQPQILDLALLVFLYFFKLFFIIYD